METAEPEGEMIMETTVCELEPPAFAKAEDILPGELIKSKNERQDDQLSETSRND